jgi:hypothetical protein
VAKFVETNHGRPNRQALEGSAPHRVLRCVVCDLEATRLSVTEKSIVVTSPIRRFGVPKEGLGLYAVEDLAAVPLHSLHEMLAYAGYDGLDFYCPSCRAVYCDTHYRLSAYWDDGYYDYTLARCPKWHERIIDD